MIVINVKCDYCGNFYDDNLTNCPSCGAANEHIRRTSDGIPKTIEELKEWYKERNLPDEEITRFFIGKDYKGPKSFGIYRDGEKVIVYKNKADGSRAIRYQGTDEAYAVNELYTKMKEVITDQKGNNRNSAVRFGRNSGAGNNVSPTSKKAFFALIFGIAFVMIIMAFIAASDDSSLPSDGYYKYENDYYYCHGFDWYRYDDYYDNWEEIEVPKELHDNHSNYYSSSYYSDGYGVSDIEDSTYAESWGDDTSWDSDNSWDSDDDDSWDSDNSWDSDDSWDSDFGDWDSDW